MTFHSYIFLYIYIFGCFCSSEGLRRVAERHRSKDSEGMTLRKWLDDGRCFNVMLSPSFNCHYPMFGLISFLKEHQLFDNMMGMSACSGGCLTAAFVAAGKSFDYFKRTFPEAGWSGFAGHEPKVSEEIHAFFQKTLPPTFQELQHPVAMSLTNWDDIDGLKVFNYKKAHGVSVTNGSLHDTMFAAMVLPSPSCPKCTEGLHPRTFQGKYPVTDGGFLDVWGANGLKALHPCPKILHLHVLDYDGQVEPPKLGRNQGMPSHAKEMVSISIISYNHVYGFLYQWLHKTQKNSTPYNDIMYFGTADAMSSLSDEPLSFQETSAAGKQGGLVIVPAAGGHEDLSDEILAKFSNLIQDFIWALDENGGQEHDRILSHPVKAVELNLDTTTMHLKHLARDVQDGKFP